MTTTPTMDITPEQMALAGPGYDKDALAGFLQEIAEEDAALAAGTIQPPAPAAQPDFATLTVEGDEVEAENDEPAGEARPLAGKFKSPEELEKAYLALQQKLGQRAAEPEAAAEPEPVARLSRVCSQESPSRHKRTTRANSAADWSPPPPSLTPPTAHRPPSTLPPSPLQRLWGLWRPVMPQKRVQPARLVLASFFFPFSYSLSVSLYSSAFSHSPGARPPNHPVPPPGATLAPPRRRRQPVSDRARAQLTWPFAEMAAQC